MTSKQGYSFLPGKWKSFPSAFYQRYDQGKKAPWIWKKLPAFSVPGGAMVDVSVFAKMEGEIEYAPSKFSVAGYNGREWTKLGEKDLPTEAFDWKEFSLHMGKIPSDVTKMCVHLAGGSGAKGSPVTTYWDDLVVKTEAEKLIYVHPMDPLFNKAVELGIF